MRFLRMGTVFTSLFAVSNPARAHTTVSLGAGAKRAGFGAGCYWGTEKFFKSEFGSVIANGQVGFMGPSTAKVNPTYAQVCTGSTQHVEVYDFEYDGKDETYEKLVKHFFKFHDPTTLDRQGNDRGTQYASVIYVYDDKQREIASRLKQELQQAVNEKKITAYKEKTVVTDIRDATVFYPAHLEHQNYLELNPGGYCNHNYRFKEWPKLSKLSGDFSMEFVNEATSLTNEARATKKACFAAGCYWGTEKFFKTAFKNKIFNGQVGFMGPPTALENPTYREVCGGFTQHTEVFHFEYYDEEGAYEQLVKHFFKFHDPTTAEGQGGDIGPMYKSVIYVFDEEQRAIASKVKAELQSFIDQGKLAGIYRDSSVSTAICEATVFYSAHEEHQAYLDKNPEGYCNHSMRFNDWFEVKSTKKACFAAGCYWGTEHYFKQYFKGVIFNGRVGFMGPPGATAHPTYKEVRAGQTQQIEVYHFEYVDGEGVYEQLVKHFFKFHDPTTPEGQGEDVGSMYVSVIYVFDEEQRSISSKVKAELQSFIDQGKLAGIYRDSSVSTAICEATVFYSAHEEHQAYLDKNPEGYCNHSMRFTTWF